MKISELIDKLQHLQAEHGDVDVYVLDYMGPEFLTDVIFWEAYGDLPDRIHLEP